MSGRNFHQIGLHICGAEFFLNNIYPILLLLVFFLNINRQKLTLCNIFQNAKRFKGLKNKLEGLTLATTVASHKDALITYS